MKIKIFFRFVSKHIDRDARSLVPEFMRLQQHNIDKSHPLYSRVCQQLKIVADQSEKVRKRGAP